MSEMLEKAARAACKAAGHDPDGPVCDIYFHDDPDAGKPWASYRSVARAVLLAIREPNDAMLEAYTNAEVASDPGQSPDAYHCSPDGFAAMIDEVLK